MKILKFIFGGLGLLGGILAFCLLSFGDGRFHVFVLDIGQGDSILIQTPLMEHILIDGGPDDKVLSAMSRVLPFYERTIDAVVLTHPHADHVNGLVEVLKRYQVKQVMITGVDSKLAAYGTFLDLIRQKKIVVLLADGSHDYQIGNVVLDMLYPFQSLQGQVLKNWNNSSIVFRAIYGKRIFYFSGDLEKEKERELVAKNLDLHADFLKAGHHGSKTSSTEPFLDRVHPKFAAISCGVANKFHHPHPSTLAHLAQHGIKTYRTDLDGTVEAVSDGNSLRVKLFGKSDS